MGSGLIVSGFTFCCGCGCGCACCWAALAAGEPAALDQAVAGVDVDSTAADPDAAAAEPTAALVQKPSRLEQNARCQRRSADDVPQSTGHTFRLFDPSAACAVPDLSSCLPRSIPREAW